MTSPTPEKYEPAGTGDTSPEAGETPDASPGLRPSLEAIMLVADEPVPLVVLAQVLERPRNEVEAELRDLAASYVAEGRGFDLREIAGGWRFYTREDCAPLVERFVSDGRNSIVGVPGDSQSILFNIRRRPASARIGLVGVSNHSE
jgi:segregation and condensation protein B